MPPCGVLANTCGVLAEAWRVFSEACGVLVEAWEGAPHRTRWAGGSMREAEPLVHWYFGRYLRPWNSPRSDSCAVRCTRY